MVKVNKKTEEGLLWFTKLFGIDKAQYEIDFVDFRIDRDVPLYIDPYAIAKDPTDLAAHCHNAVVSFFEQLLDAIRSNNQNRVRELLEGHLSEPDQIHLGVSKRVKGGRGIGREQERQIIDAVKNSTAAKVGIIQAIQEMELHVPNIGPDKVSDLVANVILGYLAEYTKEVCEAHGVNTRPCAVDGYWNEETLEWDAGMFDLPVDGAGVHSYILVPKRFVRKPYDLMNHRQFYEKYVLTIIQREHQNADDSLVKSLQKGKREITKKSLKAQPQYKISKELITDFIIKHPESIEEYREELLKRFKPADPAIKSGKAAEEDPRVFELLDKLPTINPGKEQEKVYHNTVFELIEFVFDQFLTNFEKEYKTNLGRGRIDIMSDNSASGGFFSEMRDIYRATSVPMECKNYGKDLGNDQFNQLMSRLSPKTSQLGILFCREISNRKAAIEHLRDRYLYHGSTILVFDDTILGDFVRMRLDRNFIGIENRLRVMVRDVENGHVRK